MSLRFAPRYDDRLLDLIRRLDDRSVPMAEVVRRVGAAAERLGIARPSYAHVRRLLHVERAKRDAILEVVRDIERDVRTGRLVDAYEVADRIAEARAAR